MNDRALLRMARVALPLLLISPGIAANAGPQPEHATHGNRHAEIGHKENTHSMRDAVLWTKYPRLKIMMGGENRAQREVTLLPKNIAPNSVDAYSSNIKSPDAHRQLSYDLVTAKLDKSATGGFYWLSAREDQADKVTVASTVYYMSERGSKNPTAMFMQQKNALEIIPQPFPREHSRYRANEDWKFLVRFNSQPLVQQKVNVVTQNGSKIELLSDAQGIVTVQIPDDFKALGGQYGEQKQAGGHNHGRRSSEFVLATEYADAGKTYLTGFNNSYGPDAFDQRSLVAGLGFMLLGMMGAAPLLRNRKVAKKAAGTGKKEL